MRGILRALPGSESKRGLTTIDLAQEIYGSRPTRAQLTSVTRAAGRLVTLGVVRRIHSDTGVLLYVRAVEQPSDTAATGDVRDGIPTAWMS